VKLLAFYIIGHGSGYGHMYRSKELVRVARTRGYDTAIACNNHSTRYYVSDWDDEDAIRYALADYRPDWILVDLPVNLAWIKGLAHEFGAQVCLLNPVGLTTTEQEYAYADAIWRQDTPKTIILRPEYIDAVTYEHESRDWYVFGGAEDLLDVGGAFIKAMPDSTAWIVSTNLTVPQYAPGNKHRVVQPEGDVLQYMQRARKACLHCGVSAWETAAVGLPTYLFSKTEDHLATARKMQDMGLVLAWDGLGLPSKKDVREFLLTPFKPSGERPDGKAADRLLDMIEGKPNEMVIVDAPSGAQYVAGPTTGCTNCD
jgi:hypothetical protein